VTIFVGVLCNFVVIYVSYTAHLLIMHFKNALLAFISFINIAPRPGFKANTA
jgi:hypothetical protein